MSGGSVEYLSVEDLLYHYPREWQDRSKLIPISAAKPGEHVTLCGVIRGAAKFTVGGEDVDASAVEFLWVDDPKAERVKV